MATQANLTIADGQASPVNHTFTAKGVRNGIAKWLDQVGGVYAGMPRITLSQREPVAQSPSNLVTILVRLPVLDSGATVPTVAYENMAEIKIRTHERSTLAERKDLAAYVKNLIALAVMQSTVTDNEIIY